MATALVASTGGRDVPASSAGGRPDDQHNPIQVENAREGARDWQLTRVRLDSTKGFRSPMIEGYCSRQSVKAGETLDIMVSTRPACPFKVEIFRTGYYGGRGARLMATYGPIAGEVQADPEVGPRRLRECRGFSAAQCRAKTESSPARFQ